MLYKKNKEKTLSAQLFRNPTSEYRGTPFWAWNDRLTKEELERQIDVFRDMGLGGFHMHVRTGLKNEYLSDEFMDLVRACVDKAKANEMLAWAYDEDRWPSGAAGGLVTKDERYRARCLLFTNAFTGETYVSDDSSSRGGRSGKGKLLACYDVTLDDDGFLKDYRRIEPQQDADGMKWYAFLEINQPSPWYNNQTYVDTLNREAMERFIAVTHERYKEKVGDAFGETMPAIFTDEPQFSRKSVLQTSVPQGDVDVTMPWTDRVPQLYFAQYGADIFDTLPEIFWETREGVSVHRYRYHDFIAELFAQSFADTVGGWCAENGIALTGHMMEEPTLHSQTAALGEAMRSYRSFGIPGIDLLCNNHEFTTAKQAQSASRQLGKEGVLSELYGVTGWDCDFRTYKHQGDWQAALGITVRVPHLSWYSMQGEAKRDYPASISYQSPWVHEWPAIEDHFARVNTALTRGKAKVRVAVVHPVESFWLHWGPNDKTDTVRADMDARFLALTQWLLEGMIDFDFLSESMLPKLCPAASAPLKAGEMAYDTIIVPGCETLRSSTLERLEAFRAAGGRLIFLGSAPKYCDAVPSDRGAKLFSKSEQVEYAHAAVLSALESDRFLSMQYDNGKPTDEFLHQLRTDNDGDWLFIAHTREPYNKDVEWGKKVVLRIRGEVIPQVYDTQTGDTTPIGADYENGCTVIRTVFYGYDSLLLKLTEGRTDAPCEEREEDMPGGKVVAAPESYACTEDNVLVLDMAEYALDGEAFRAKEEILRLDNVLRKELGFPERGGQVAQPWTLPPEEITHTVTLRFTVESETDIDGAMLALEDAAVSEIAFNGEAVPSAAAGNYVDIAISKVALPRIRKGVNTLVVKQPFGTHTNTEDMFILGDFGVRLCGDRAVLTKKPESLRFGDLRTQGFPFYGGGMRYTFRTESRNGQIKLIASWYRGALVKVYCDGEAVGRIIYPPYTLQIDGLADGEHTITLELLIHRYNTFGPIHLVDEKESWHGPGAWRSDGHNWSYSYVLRRTGILKAPEIL